MPNPTGKTLTQATIRLREYKNVKIDRIRKPGMCKQILWEVIGSPFPECFMGKGIMGEYTGDTHREETHSKEELEFPCIGRGSGKLLLLSSLS